MAPTVHSIVSASASKRTLECPGWVNLTSLVQAQLQGTPAVRRSSIYAAEGTAAHGIAEDHLNAKADLQSRLGETITVDGHDITVDQDMIDHVQEYVDFVDGLRALGYEVFLEQRVSINWLWEMGLDRPAPYDLFGTSDCIAIHRQLKHMVVGDLKFGRGVAVEAKDNSQGRYYALGALPALGNLLDNVGPDEQITIETVDVVIVQPRAPHPAGTIRKETLFIQQLMTWANQVLVPAVDRTCDPRAPLKAGKHCQFCPNNGPLCPELERTAQATARHIFDDEATEAQKQAATARAFDLTQLGDLLEKLDVLEDWIAATRQFAHDQIEGGGEVPGWKLVEKRATRRWNDEEAARLALEAGDVPPAKFMEFRLKSPAQVFKALKGDTVADVLAGYVTTQSSGNTLARAADPRPAVVGRPTAKDAFAEPTDTKE
jgi:hypothetical protein